MTILALMPLLATLVARTMLMTTYIVNIVELEVGSGRLVATIMPLTEALETALKVVSQAQ